MAFVETAQIDRAGKDQKMLLIKFLFNCLMMTINFDESFIILLLSHIVCDRRINIINLNCVLPNQLISDMSKRDRNAIEFSLRPDLMLKAGNS